MDLSRSERELVLRWIQEACTCQARRYGLPMAEILGRVYERVTGQLMQLDLIRVSLEHYVRRSATEEARRACVEQKGVSLARTRRRHEQLGMDLTQWPDTRTDPPTEAIRAELFSRVWAGLAQMPTAWRDALEKYQAVERGEQTLQSLAKNANCSRQHLHRLRNKALNYLRHHVGYTGE